VYRSSLLLYVSENLGLESPLENRLPWPAIVHAFVQSLQITAGIGGHCSLWSSLCVTTVRSGNILGYLCRWTNMFTSIEHQRHQTTNSFIVERDEFVAVSADRKLWSKRAWSATRYKPGTRLESLRNVMVNLCHDSKHCVRDSNYSHRKYRKRMNEAQKE
jgi:hypothetical protein